MNKNLRRSVVALATALVCLALNASPASANPTHTFTITGVDAIVRKADTTIETIPLGTGTPDCTQGGVLAHTQTNPVDVVDIQTLVHESRFQPSTSTSTYIFVFTRIGSTSGNIALTTGVVTGLGLTLRLDIFAPSNTVDCDHGTTRSCRFDNLGLVFNGSSANNIMTLSSTSRTLASSPPCIALFTSWNTGTIEINLTIQVD